MGPCRQVLHGENTAPRIAAKFYKAVVQAVLLYGSKTWNLTNLALARLKGFHVRTAFKMARKHQPKRSANGVWVYPKLADVLEECGMATITTFIQSCHYHPRTVEEIDAAATSSKQIFFYHINLYIYIKFRIRILCVLLY